MIFALVGNQNCGKTTLFNALTGSNQHVGNFPGVTVDQKTGEIRGEKGCSVVDLPGADGPLRGHLRQSVSRSDEGPLGLSRAPSILGIESGGSMCYTGLTFSGGKLYDTQ